MHMASHTPTPVCLRNGHSNKKNVQGIIIHPNLQNRMVHLTNICVFILGDKNILSAPIR